MTTRRWVACSIAVVMALGFTVAARAQRGASQSRTTTTTTAKNFVNSTRMSKATWGLAAQPDYGSIAFAPDGTLYAANGANNRVYKVTSRGPHGHTTVVAGSGPGIDFSGAGYQHWKYVRHHGWVTVGAYGGDGQHWTDALLSAPFYLTFDAAGNMYVTDHLNSRIREFTTDGFVQTVAGSGNGDVFGGVPYGVWTSGVGPEAGDGGLATRSVLEEPFGIVVDSHGNLFIADRDHDAVRKVDTNGIITTVAGTGYKGYNGDNRPARRAKLDRPLDVAVDGAGNLYIDDENNRRIRMVDHNGIITTFAGNGRYGCGGDGGPAVDASFRDPNLIDFAPDGSMLITDNECRNVRRIAPDGTITTFLGRWDQSCGDLIGVTVRHLPESEAAWSPDGDLYLNTCHRILRVDDNGITHLFARAPVRSDLPKP